ncbi:MAG TPA: hypothetical protein VGV38_07650 [Pyrinomonadaceae bacterium]|nr:hypothetical protein [Pyrinomonadaceae bacterium]
MSTTDEQRQTLTERRTRFADERSRLACLSVPELIELLSSESLRTRFLAEMCLRDAANL